MMMEYKILFPALKEKTAALFGDQVSLSYPMPDTVNGIRVEKFFLYSASPAPQRPRPFGLLTVSMETGSVLAYEDCRLQDFMDTAAHPFDAPVSYALPRKLGVKEFKLQQGLINKLYEAVREMAFSQELTDSQQEILQRYWVMLEAAVPADLLPYYQTMGKNFFDWGVNYV